MRAFATSLLLASLLFAHPAAAQDTGPLSSSAKEEQKASVEDAEAAEVAKKAPRSPTQQIDPRIYDAEPLTTAGTRSTVQPHTAPTPVPVGSSLVGSSLLAEGAAAREAAAQPPATVLQSIGAAVSQSLPVRALHSYKAPKFAAADDFKTGEFIDNNVDFRLDMNDEEFLMKSKSEEEARHRIEIVRERQRAAAVWHQNSQLINSMIAAVVLISVVLWWWLSGSSRTKTRVTRWTVQGVVLLGSFYLHWTFGLFMLLGLYTHVAKSHRRA